MPAIARATILGMEFQVEREIDQHWYPVEGLIEAGSAGQAVRPCRGAYRARATDTPDGEPEHFEFPAWGQPIPVRGR